MLLSMGFFGKKKKSDGTSNPAGASNSSNGNHSTSSHHTRQQQLNKGSVYPNKSVRFAAVSDDEGGFVTDSELEINRHTRYGSLRVRPTQAPVTKLGFIDRSAIAKTQLYDSHNGRTQSYSERQAHIQPSTAADNSLWNTNGVSHYQNGTSVDDDYMSDSSSASSFVRGARMRNSLPTLRSVNTKPTGLVFLTYQNETKKAVLPPEIKNLDTIKALFLRCFPQQLTPDLLNSPKRRFYILDRSSNKFFLLVHLQEVRDGTMLKLVDSDALTPSTVRRSRSAHASISNDAHYYSEPEFDIDTASTRLYGSLRPLNRMTLTKETNIDEPLNNTWSYPHSTQPPISGVSQPMYMNAAPGSHPADHMNNSSQMISNTQSLSQATAQASYIPPQVLQSTIQHTKADLIKDPNSLDSDMETASISSKDSSASSEIAALWKAKNGPKTERNRMAKMESQIANLTAWVQTAITNRPDSAASDRASEVSYQSTSNRSKAVVDYDEIARMLGISGTSSCTPQPQISEELVQNISKASSKVKDLKSEFKQLRRIHEAQAESIQDSIKDAMAKIQNAVQTIPGANQSPLRTQRCTVDVTLDSYRHDYTSMINQVGELEACVSELRADVVSKRCHVNMSEVEALALKLSKATRGAADLKSKFPTLSREVKAVSQGEVDNVIKQQEFLRREPERIEDALKRCKTVTNVLFTLKRLAAVDSHRKAIVPNIQTKLTEEPEKKQLLREIQSITPNHAERIKSIQDAEKSVARRKNVMLAKEDLKFEKSLELASKNLKDAEQLPKANLSSEDLSEKLEQAKQQSNSNTNSNGHNNNHSAGEVVIRRAKPEQRLELSLPFIQNRDSIHWDADSDSEEDAENSARPFIDVTESSAFTVVPSRASQNMVRTNPHVSPSDRPQWRPNPHSTIPNGKIYTPPKQPARSPPDEARRRDLQEQCQRLQELQRHHRHTPTIPGTRVPVNTPNATPNAKIAPYSTTPLTRNSMGNGKPMIAPKPQALRGKLSASIKPRTSEQDCQSSTDSDSDQSLKEAKSTTV